MAHTEKRMTRDVYHDGGSLASVNAPALPLPDSSRSSPWSLACALAALNLLGLCILGCDDDGTDALRRARAAKAAAARESASGAVGGSASSQPGTVASSVRALAERLEDGGAIEPAPNGGDLGADIERFTSLDACVVSRRVEDAVLGDALLALGYDGFTKDACRVLQAAKAKRRELCRDITVSTLQRHCEIVVAVVAKEPEQCPKELLGRGREPTCLALATRDRRLCAAVEESDRPRCEAMLAGDTKRCATSTRTARGACERDAERWRAILTEASAANAAAPFTAPAGKFRIEAKPGAPMRGKGEGDLAFELRRGVVVVEERGATSLRRIDIGAIGDSLSASGSMLESAVRATIEWPTPAEGKANAASEKGEKARVRKLELVVPGGGSYTAPPTNSALTVTTKKLDPQRGGIVELVIDGTVGEGERVYGVHVEVRTFVRDVVVASATTTMPTVKPR